jgi:hypothetical protein
LINKKIFIVGVNIIMKLERFKKDKKQKNIIIALGIFIVLIGGIIKAYNSYAIYQEERTFNVINGQVPEFKSNDIQIAYTVDGEKASSFPEKGDYDVTVDCNGTATGEWDTDEWALKISNATADRVKCSISFEKISILKDKIITLAESDTTNLAYDETTDNNLRYIGADPDNYLCFDKECTNGRWRVIGIMNNIETKEHGTQSLVKIIRADSIGNIAWDGNNVNDWTTASLQTSLNSGDGELYTTYIKNYDSLFEIVTWNLGGTASYTSSSNGLASHFYGYERGTTTDRATCLATALYSWYVSSVSDCKNNDYLYLKSTEWTLTPYSGNSDFVFYVYSTGIVSRNYSATDSNAVRPVGYLISNTKILSGDGTSDSPWIIAD